LLEDRDAAVVVLEQAERIFFSTDRAHELLVRYFGDNGARLPEALSGWLESQGSRDEPLEVRHGATLVVRRAGDALLLDEHRRSPRLTPREQQILELVADGRTNVEVADALCLAPGTVRRHLENIFGKLGVHNRTAAVAELRRDTATS
jgi:DNA-binding NarL/FixJ family response regulator